jgi:hypothetical protein
LAGHDLVHPGKHQTKLCKDLRPINKWVEDHYIPLEWIVSTDRLQLVLY